MRRFVSACVVVMLVALASVQPALAAAPSQAKAAKPLDLATMVLVPADLKIRKDAAIVTGAWYTVADDDGDKATALNAAGDIAGYETWLSTPGDAKERTWQVAVALDEFKTADGAAAGFAALASGTSVVSDQTLGDQAGISTYDGQDGYDPNKPDKGQTLVFRLDRIVATVYVDDYTGTMPKASEAEALGRILAGRITSGLAGKLAAPGLSTHTLRLAVPQLQPFQDNYYRLDGKDRFGTLFDGAPKGSPTFDDSWSHATDVYYTGQNDGGDASAATYFARQARFSSNYWAAKYVKNYLTHSAAGTGGWQHVKEVKGAQDFGDQSHTATFSIPASKGAPGPTIYGTVIVARSGATIVTIRVQAFKRVPVALVEGLMKAQMTCLKSTSACSAGKVPAAMSELHLSSGMMPGARLAPLPRRASLDSESSRAMIVPGHSNRLRGGR